jgi:AcrR family transcriptional regulator
MSRSRVSTRQRSAWIEHSRFFPGPFPFLLATRPSGQAVYPVASRTDFARAIGSRFPHQLSGFCFIFLAVSSSWLSVPVWFQTWSRLKQEFANPDVKCDNVPELTVPLNRDTAVEWAGRAGDGTSRSDARENRERILEAASRLLAQSPAASLGDVAAAAGVSRSTLYRHFAGRQELIAALGQRPREEGSQGRAEPFPPGRLGRERPVPPDGLGGGTRATASSAVALGALRASRRGGGTTREALMLMHTTLRQMPGPHAEMTAVAARWDPASRRLSVTNCGQVTPIIIRADQEPQRLRAPNGRGLGGRSSPTPTEQTISLEPGDRLVMVSNGVVGAGKGKAGLGIDGLIEAALRSERATAADTVRKLQTAVLEASGGELEDDATMVCLSVDVPALNRATGPPRPWPPPRR